MGEDAGGAAEALEQVRRARTKVAAQADCPPERHLALALVLGAMVAGQAAPEPWPMTILTLALCAVAAISAYDRKRGVFVNGYRAGATLPVTLGLLGFSLTGLIAGLVLKDRYGVAWAPLPAGALVAAAGYVGGRLWSHLYRREMGAAL